MIPDIKLQLQVILKSLKDNVAPAVDAGNQLAQQQLQLSLAALQIVIDHLPMIHGALRKDIAEHSAMAESLLSLVSETNSAALKVAIVASNAALLDATMGLAELQEQARALRAAIGLVIADSQSNPQIDAIERIVLVQSASTLHLGRAWNKPMGFEPDPDAVVALGEQLA